MDTLDTEKTINFLIEALAEDPNNTKLRLRLASAYLSNNDLEKAKKQCTILLSQDPQNNDALLLLDKITSGDTSSVEATEEQPEKVSLLAEGEEAPQNTMKSWFEKSSLTFEDVGGMDALKEEIKVGIVYPFEHPELFEKYGKRVGGGILLYGPPGCGKTYIAKATAGQIKAMFLSLNIEDILDMWLGESEKRMHGLFQAAREVAPSVVFIDEVDALGADRMKVARSGASTLVNQFLVELDGMHSHNDRIMVIGATNTPWHIDPAFRRPGRFDKVIFVPPPDEVARAEIFKIHLKNKPTSSIDYLTLAEKTTLYSGADIASVCEKATEKVIREALSSGTERDITMDDLLSVIRTTKPTTKEWFETAKNFARYANESGTYTPILNFMKENRLS